MIAYSDVTLLADDDTAEEGDGIVEVPQDDVFPVQRDRLAVGRYRVGGELHRRMGSYRGYSAFRDALAASVGGGSAREMWEHEELPCQDLICFRDCEGTIGPETCARLAAELRAHRAVFAAGGGGEDPADWLWMYDALLELCAFAAPRPGPRVYALLALREMCLGGRAAAVLPSTRGACGACGAPAALRRSRCRRVVYCGVDCQRAAWEAHESSCGVGGGGGGAAAGVAAVGAGEAAAPRDDPRVAGDCGGGGGGAAPCGGGRGGGGDATTSPAQWLCTRAPLWVVKAVFSLLAVDGFVCFC